MRKEISSEHSFSTETVPLVTIPSKINLSRLQEILRQRAEKMNRGGVQVNAVLEKGVSCLNSALVLLDEVL